MVWVAVADDKPIFISRVRNKDAQKPKVNIILVNLPLSLGKQSLDRAIILSCSGNCAESVHIFVRDHVRAT